ncbi:hypothetical protein PF001_g25730 [Phytophthora fragariae]|uniref:Uncharacterized protein n=1 Tax=Phytophthora fragariae TaxID=53985 RepID=A0A6A4BMG5_9STRA|nr:hypothetical protein PF001_g25730 [Phytophthora fragariae]
MKHDSAVDFYILIRVQAGSAEDSRESGQTRQTHVVTADSAVAAFAWMDEQTSRIRHVDDPLARLRHLQRLRRRAALIARQEERHRLYDSEHSEHSGSSGVGKRHGDGYGDATTTSNDEPVGLATGEPREHGGGGHYAASCCDYDIFNPSYGERRSRDTAHVTSGICDAREAKKTRGDSTAFRRSIGSNDSSGGRYDVSAGSCNLAAADCRTTSGYAAS